ncbi:receptor like protein 30 [Raphanus sativus]|nr:receptor like protein 30 [Raphanus sativus]
MMSSNQYVLLVFFVSLIYHNTLASPWLQRDALLEFKNEFPINASDPDDPINSWNRSTDYCSWEGVTCDRNSGKIDLSGNSFVGNFPASLLKIPSLEAVYLEGNQFEGSLEFHNASSSSVDTLLLSHNNFSRVSESISGLAMLSSLALGYNSFVGPIPVSISGIPNLSQLDLSHNGFTGPIPGSMSKLVYLFILDLSYNKLEGQVPSFVWGVYGLTLSHNYFSSLEKPRKVVDDKDSIDKVSFDLGSNSLRGPFPQWLCKVRLLEFLDMSNNHLNGSIPPCFLNPPFLKEVSLRKNNLSGFLPDMYSSQELKSLDVSGNQLVGKLPRSLIGCNYLEFLNLKGNNLRDTFPSWLRSLERLRVLLLGSNAFYGPIYTPSSSSTDFGFSTLRVIDISHNNFSGTLPRDYFANWLEMSSVWKGEKDWSDLPMYEGNQMDRGMYENSMVMIYKGVETEFSEILLAFKAIDFSGNNFSGEIPESIGLLKGLRLLNLSGNSFTSSIPSTLANITYLEALDLSRNNLSGHIPLDLDNLTFLSYMDFSHNLLEGPVPRGTQFQRQNCSSFADNVKLYGLEEICGPIHVPDAAPPQQPKDSSSEPEDVLNWIAAAIAYGPGVICGLVIGHIFNSHKHERLMRRFRRNNPSGTTRVH